MKRLFCFCVPLVLLSATFLSAQETFAPLITENCLAIVHLDVDKIDVDRIKAESVKAANLFLQDLAFDSKSLDATNRELSRELEKLDAVVRPPYETVTKKLGIRELAIVVDLELLQNGIPGLVAIPWKNKTEQDLETLKSLFPDDLPLDTAVAVKDLLLFPVSEHAGDISDGIKEWVENAKTSKDALIYGALDNVKGAELKIAIALPKPAKELISTIPLPPEVCNEVRNLVSFATQKIEWGAAKLSLDELMSEESGKSSNVLFTLKTVKRTDALQLRSLLENMIELGVNMARFGVEAESKTRGETPPPALIFEFIKGFARTLLPDVEGDKLVFRLKAAKGLGGQSVLATGGVATALLLPAVQAAREAARRMECSNNMKQIVIAFHNYHDTFQALPPLYTVDKNGKPLHSWRVLILPFTEEAALYKQIRLDEPWDSEHNSKFHAAMPKIFRCPSCGESKPESACNYSVIAGEVFVPAKKAGDLTGNGLAQVVDGTSNTIALVEVKEPFCWMDPKADLSLNEWSKGINAEDGRAGSRHPGGANAGLLDGSVRFFSNDVSSETLKALGARDSGKVVP